MTTMESTATLPEAKTAPPINGIDLPTVVSGVPAPRHDGKNLFIEIDVRSDEAVFHCQDPEHVGTHKQRHVLFCANKHCWLIFTNPLVFTEPYLELMKGEDQAAQVSDKTTKVETSYRIRVDPAEAAKVAKMMNAATTPKRPPVIVVP